MGLTGGAAPSVSSSNRHQESTIGHTGAEAILLRKSTVDSQGLISTQAPNTEIIFGNGHSTVTDKKTIIGDVEALICEDGILQEDLLSVNSLLDIGFKLTMNKSSGLLHNEATGASINVQREGKRWAVDLEDLASAMKANPDLIENPAMDESVKANAVVHRDPKSIRDQVIQLHERMGHHHVRRSRSRYSNMDTFQRSIMRKHPCTICLLAKRQKPPVANPSGESRDMRPGECISGDIVPITPPAHDGSTMFFLFADVATGFMMAYRFPQGSRNTQTTWIRGENIQIRRRNGFERRRDGTIFGGQWILPRTLHAGSPQSKLRRAICQHHLPSYRDATSLSALPQEQTLGLGSFPRHRLQESNAQ